MMHTCTESRFFFFISIKRKSAIQHKQNVFWHRLNTSLHIIQGTGTPSKKMPHEMKTGHSVPSHSSQQKRRALAARHWHHLILCYLKRDPIWNQPLHKILLIAHHHPNLPAAGHHLNHLCPVVWSATRVRLPDLTLAQMICTNLRKAPELTSTEPNR